MIKIDHSSQAAKLAKRVVRLQEALYIANQNANKNGKLGVIAEDENTHVNQYEANTFYAKVRKQLKETE